MRRTTPTNNLLKWLEYLFLVIGLFAIDYFIWVKIDTKAYQVYEEWRFERALRGESASIGRFVTGETGLRRLVGLGHEPQRNATEPGRNGVETQPSTTARRHHRHHAVDELVGRIEIPRLQVAAIVREGADEKTLSRAVGHIPSTAFPGEVGNAAFAGHRDTFFRALRNIRKNDKIVVNTLDGSYEYLVQSTKIVSPNDVSVLKPVSADKELTLVTCYPFYYIGSAPKRFIVHATQVAATPQQPQQAIGS